MATELTHTWRPSWQHPFASPTDLPRAQSNTVQDPWVPNVLGGPKGGGIDKSSDSRHVSTSKPARSHRLTLSHTDVCCPARPGRGHRSPGKLVDLLLQLPPSLPEKSAAALWLHWWPCTGHCDLRTRNVTEQGKELLPFCKLEATKCSNGALLGCRWQRAWRQVLS